MYLLIDDTRDYGANIIARTIEAGKLVLKQLVGDISVLGIDHDLGGIETGCDVIQWAIKNHCLPSRVQVVTWNPVGRKAIVDILLDNGYQSEDNTNFVKKD